VLWLSTAKTALEFSPFGLHVTGVAVGSAEYMETAINLSWGEKTPSQTSAHWVKEKCVLCVAYFLRSYVSHEYHKICYVVYRLPFQKYRILALLLLT
jgi:hypothetical protein